MAFAVTICPTGYVAIPYLSAVLCLAPRTSAQKLWWHSQGRGKVVQRLSRVTLGADVFWTLRDVDLDFETLFRAPTDSPSESEAMPLRLGILENALLLSYSRIRRGNVNGLGNVFEVRGHSKSNSRNLVWSMGLYDDIYNGKLTL